LAGHDVGVSNDCPQRLLREDKVKSLLAAVQDLLSGVPVDARKNFAGSGLPRKNMFRS